MSNMIMTPSSSHTIKATYSGGGHWKIDFEALGINYRVGSTFDWCCASPIKFPVTALDDLN